MSKKMHCTIAGITVLYCNFSAETKSLENKLKRKRTISDKCFPPDELEDKLCHLHLERLFQTTKISVDLFPLK